MDWETRRAHLLSVPSRDGLAAMARAVGGGARPVRVRRLGGGLATATHAVDLRARNGAVLHTVVKRYRQDDGTAALEWERLCCASTLEIPTPEPLALDASGEWFGAPALVMRRVAGRAHHTPADPDAWLRDIARTLVAVADGPTRGVPPAVRRPLAWQPPSGLRRTALTEAAVELLDREVPGTLGGRRVFAHCDFHPGNLLWSRGRLSGVVDWSAARLAPRAYDVAYCRADLCVLAGPAAAARMLEHYERIWGGRLDRLPVWDLACGLNALRWSHLWAIAYAEQGRTDLTTARVKARSAAMVRRALAHL